MSSDQSKIRRARRNLTVGLRRWWWVVLLILVALAVSAMFSRGVDRMATDLVNRTDSLDPKESAAALKDAYQYWTDNQIKVWTTFVQAIGAVVLAIGGYFTWRNLRATLAKLDIDRDAQITNRFTQAVTQLGAELKDGQPNLEVRLGGIYALERIARDSPRDHWTIMEVLTAYVRQNAPWPPPSSATEVPVRTSEYVRTDIQAVLTVLGRRTIYSEQPESAWLQLIQTDLRGAYLYRAHLEGAILIGAHLEGALLVEAHLDGAVLTNAHLNGAFFDRAHLDGAHLNGAHLDGAHDLTREQVESAYQAGKGALLPKHLQDHAGPPP